jgi:hypothetical protein
VNAARGNLRDSSASGSFCAFKFSYLTRAKIPRPIGFPEPIDKFGAR